MAQHEEKGREEGLNNILMGISSCGLKQMSMERTQPCPRFCYSTDKLHYIQINCDGVSVVLEKNMQRLGSDIMGNHSFLLHLNLTSENDPTKVKHLQVTPIRIDTAIPILFGTCNPSATTVPQQQCRSNSVVLMVMAVRTSG